MPETPTAAARLVDRVRSYGSVAVAMSGGVDSAVVAAAAARALGSRAVAVTGVGPAVAEEELRAARGVAELIGIRHVEVATAEIDRPEYVANAPDRCFHCKTELYGHVRRVADELGVATIVNGANADDDGDHRPGMRAAGEHGVASPLLELGIDTAEVRRIAEAWGLPTWDKPASPCLASRVAYGVRVTPERLAAIEAVEAWLRSQGIRECRVRLHDNELARIEVSPDWLPRLVAEPTRTELIAACRDAGFRLATLDVVGFRSGGLNDLVAPEELRRAQTGADAVLQESEDAAR